LHPTYYRCCWHVVSRCLFSKTSRSWQKKFTTHRPSSFTRRRGVRLSSIAHDSQLLPPVGVWSVLSTILGDHALTSPTRRCLGRPLPYQQADGPQAPPSVGSYALSLKLSLRILQGYAVLTHLSVRYSPPRGRFLRVTQPFATSTRASSGFRSTCMLKARRQRSSWARIKPSKSIQIPQKNSGLLPVISWLSKC